MPPTADTDAEEPPENRDGRRFSRQIAVGAGLLVLIAVDPALAQQSAVCEAEKLPGMIEGFFQITTAIGIIGLAIVWQADALIDMFTIEPEQKMALKRHKRSALKSAVILLVLGPLYVVAGRMMGLPLADCVNLVPW